MHQKLTRLTVLCALAGAELSLTGQTGQNSNITLPQTTVAATATLADGRYLRIYPGNNAGGEGTNTVFFHKPIFAFDERSGGAQDLPAIILKEPYRYKGARYVPIRLMLTSAPVQEASKAALLAQYRPLRDVAQQTNGLKVLPWPIEILRLSVRNSNTNEMYGTALLEAVAGAGDKVDAALEIPETQYAKFLDALKADEVSIRPSYTFENAVVAFGERTTKVSSSISQNVAERLKSERKDVDGRTVVFQDHLGQLLGALEQQISKTITATDNSIVAYLPATDIVKLILVPETVSLKDLEKKDGTLLEFVKTYIAAATKKVTTKTTENRKKTSTREDEKTHNLKFGAGAAGPSAGVDITDRQKNTLTNDYGITFEEGTERTTIEPASIKLFFERSSWQTALTDIVQRVYVSVGTNTSFVGDAAFKGSFTIARQNEAMKALLATADPHSGIQPGMAFCSFAADVPKGFVPLDGVAKFPMENWVPTHLRGKSVPDMNGKFVRGINNVAQTGDVHSKGFITIPAATIDGSGFRLASTIVVGVLPWPGYASALFYRDAERGAQEKVKISTKGILSAYPTELDPNWIAADLISVHAYDKIAGQVRIEEQRIDLGQAAAQPDNISCRWVMRTSHR